MMSRKRLAITLAKSKGLSGHKLLAAILQAAREEKAEREAEEAQNAGGSQESEADELLTFIKENCGQVLQSIMAEQNFRTDVNSVDQQVRVTQNLFRELNSVIQE